MMEIFIASIFIMLLASTNFVKMEQSSPLTVVSLQFAVNGSPWSNFGSLLMQRKFDGKISAQFSPESTDLNMDQLKQLLSAQAAANADGCRGNSPPDYQIQAKASEGDTKTKLLSSNYAADFVAANFFHLFEVVVDQTAMGQLYLLSFTHFPHPNRTALSKHENFKKVVIDSRVKSVERHPGPDTASYLKRIEEERRARQHGAMHDDRPFLAKYWMYIVPVVIFLLFSNALGDQPAAGGE